MNDRDELALHLLPGPSSEDLEQEILIAKWEGRVKYRPPYTAKFGRELGYGQRAPDNASPFFPPHEYNPEAVETLLEWMFDQSDQIQVAVLAYLSDPSERRFKTVLRLIDRATEEVRPRQSNTLVDLVVRVLPATLEDLYKMARREHQAKRPEAAVRQLLRRLTAEGRIVKKGELYYAN